MKLLEKRIVKKLIQKKLKISIAESCTGGLLSSAITSIAGSSKVFNLGLITYSNFSKINLLKVPKKIINKYGAVSQQVCFYMVKNINKIDKARLSVSITGIAGPGGGSKNKPIGLVYIGLMKNNKIKINRYLFKNRGRSYIQKTAVNKCLELILSFLK
jgi:PncC family amidohydrolase